MRALLAALCLAVFAVLAGCAKEPEIEKQQAYVFGTLVEVTVAGAPAAQARPAIAAVLAHFDAMHQQLHAWQPSELSRLNEALAQGKTATVSPGLAAMLREARLLSLRADGLFEPAIGGLIALWGFHSDLPSGHLPDACELSNWVAVRPRIADLRLEGNTVWSPNRSVQLDLGGYAKGRALDDAVTLLKRHGIRDALVNIGGNVIALGRRGTKSWRVGIQHPRRAGTLAILDLHDGEAIGTSGDYQRYFEVEGRRYSHLIDPRTGRPADSLQSVTLIASGPQAGTRSDALSKPLFLDGTKRLGYRAAQLGIADWLAVDAAGRMHVSPAMQARLQ